MAYQVSHSGYKSENQIQKQYQDRVSFLLGGRSESQLNTAEKLVLSQLALASQMDPRIGSVMFLTIGDALQGVLTANKLDKLTDEQFQVDSYVCEWINKFRGKSVFKITNEEAINALGSINEKEFGEQIATWILELVLNSLRTENYSGITGEKYFLTDFEIDPKDDFEMVSELRNHGRKFVDRLIAQECTTSDYWGGDTVLLIAECGMLGAYVLTKLGYSGKINELRRKVFKAVTESFLKDENLDFTAAIGGAEFAKLATPLYTHCTDFGENLACLL